MGFGMSDSSAALLALHKDDEADLSRSGISDLVSRKKWKRCKMIG